MMNSGTVTEWPEATIQYRLNLPHALHSISSALSALHTSRAAALHPEISAVLHSSHCPKCGTYHFSGDPPLHLVGPSSRKKRKRTESYSKALQKGCHLCGFPIDACISSSPDRSASPIQLPSGSSEPGTVSIIPQTKEIGQEPPPGDVSALTAGFTRVKKCTTVPPLPSQQSQPKPSVKKTLALKDMLSRDRQREEAIKSHKKRREGHEGLMAFLKEL